MTEVVLPRSICTSAALLSAIVLGIFPLEAQAAQDRIIPDPVACARCEVVRIPGVVLGAQSLDGYIDTPPFVVRTDLGESVVVPCTGLVRGR